MLIPQSCPGGGGPGPKYQSRAQPKTNDISSSDRDRGSPPKKKVSIQNLHLVHSHCYSILVTMGVFEGRFPQWVYLIGYNTISALLWSLIFTRTALSVAADGPEGVYPAVRILLLFTQSMAFLEVLHATMGKISLVLLASLLSLIPVRPSTLLTLARPRPHACLQDPDPDSGTQPHFVHAY